VPTTDDLRTAIAELASALQPAMIVTGHLKRTTSTDAHDADTLDRALSRATAILKRLQPNSELASVTGKHGESAAI
jgi:hypothetical protein